MRKLVAFSVISAVVTAVHPASVLAQETAPSAAAPGDATSTDQGANDENAIVVSGIRGSLVSAAAKKRDADAVVDAVTAEDIGKFPTENVADASQRITGVQITRTRGNGSQASIRGLPTAFTRVQLNGSTLTSALFDLQGGGAGGAIDRSFDFRTIPTDFVQTLEVSKSPTADQQEGGLSGTINVKTVRPLELGKTTITGSVFGVRNSNYGSITPRASLLASTVTADGRLGLLIVGGYDRSKTETHVNGMDGWNTFSEATKKFDYNGDGDKLDTFNFPSQVRTELFDEDRERINVAGVAEFQASDSLKLYAEGFYGRFKINVSDFQNLFIFTNATGPVLNASSGQFIDIAGISPTQPTYGHPFAVSFGQGAVDTRGLNRLNRSTANTYYGKGGFEFKNDQWSADAAFSYSKSDMLGDNAGVAQTARFDTTEQCLPGEVACSLTLNASSQARFLDVNQPIIASLNGAWGRQIDDSIKELTANLSREFDGPIISKISIGGVASWRTTYADARSITVTGAQLAPLLGLQKSTVTPSGYSGVPYELIVSPRKGAFLAHYNGSAVFPTSWVSSDTVGLLAAVSRADLEKAGTVMTNDVSIIDLSEDILAGYVRVDFGQPGSKLTGNIGVRVVQTKATSSGFAPDFAGIRVNVDAGGTVSVPAAAPIAVQNTYTEVLPSFNAKLKLSDTFQMRFGASRTMSRPNLADITPSTTIAGVGNNFTITAGNPNLDPFLSTNLDFTAEWYPSTNTTLTAALFYKDIASLVRPTTTTVTYPVTFFTAATNTSEVRDQNFQLTTPTNQQGVKLKGAEIGFQQFFSFLPGPFAYTGLQANYTFISNSDPQVLTAASKNNFNVSAFYEHGGLALRASYTWRDKFVTTGLPDGYFGLGQTVQPRGNLDVNVTYDVTRFLSVVFEGTNVLQNADVVTSTLGNLPQRYIDTGSQYILGARFRF